MGESVNAEQAWTEVAEETLAAPGVSSGRMFTAEGLNYGGKYFAMLCRGDLVVKLPAPRVDELEEAATGRRFEPGPGRIMREWLAIPVSNHRRWRSLVAEALDFAHHNAANAAGPTTRPQRRR
jgi:hypothetical protein